MQKIEGVRKVCAATMFETKMRWISFLLLGAMIASVISSPMYYKKTDDDTYEPGKTFVRWEKTEKPQNQH